MKHDNKPFPWSTLVLIALFGWFAFVMATRGGSRT